MRAQQISRLRERYQVLIECANETEQLNLLSRLERDGHKCRALIA